MGRVLQRLSMIAAVVPLESAVAITQELCQTVRIGISQSIQHRDIKPDNIIVRSLEAPDVIIVDYGLSFNEAEDTRISKVGERIGGAFLTVPERHIPGGDRLVSLRHEESCGQGTHDLPLRHDLGFLPFRTR